MPDPLAAYAFKVLTASRTSDQAGGYLGTVGSREAAVERTWTYLQRVPKYPPAWTDVHIK